MRYNQTHHTVTTGSLRKFVIYYSLFTPYIVQANRKMSLYLFDFRGLICGCLANLCDAVQFNCIIKATLRSL